jgi:hypothetical protein
MSLIRHNNICKRATAVLLVVCFHSFAMTATEAPSQVVSLPSDTVVVPAKYNRGNTGPSRLVIVDQGSSISRPEAMNFQSTDSLPAQVFRVQLYTSKLYGDATRLTRIGKELCLPPVTLDYDVPYYKVRAGAFSTRIEAEIQVARAKALGFGEAWVVVTANPLRKSNSGFSDSTSATKIGQQGQ